MGFGSIIFLLHFVVGAYLFFSLFAGSPKSSEKRRVLGLLFITVAVSLSVFGRMAHRSFNWSMHEYPLLALYWISYATMGTLAIVAIYTISFDLFRASRWIFRKLNSKESRPDLARRRFLFQSGATGVLVASGLSSGIGIAQAATGPSIKRVNVPIRGLHPDLNGLTIAQISDLHIGPLIGREYVERVVRMTNELKPDLIALTGDFVDGSVEELREGATVLRDLRSKHGIFYCTGNHEFYSGVMEWMKEFRSYGFRVLENEHEILSIGGAKLLMGGVHDYMASRRSQLTTSPSKSIEGAPSDAALKILLAHQPRSCFEASKAGYDIQLSGHTHAGQFFPFSLFVWFAHPYLSGLNRHDEKMWVYVNQGTGYWGPPLRFAVPSELTLLTLTAEA